MKLKQGMSGSYLKSFLIRIKHLIRKDYVIGFDLGMEKLNMVQVGYHSNNQPYIHATASDYHNIDLNDLLANLNSLKKQVKNSLQSRKFTGRKVVSSIPAHYLKILFLNYQVGKSENDTESLLLSLKKRINGDLNDYVIDYIPIKPDAIERNDRMALVAMAKQNIVEQYLDFLADCGLEVVALEIGPVAIRRLVNALTASDEKQKVLTINFGTKISYLTVIWNNELLFDRKLDFGFETIISVIAKGFDVSVQTAFEILHKYGLDDAKRAVLSDSDNIEDIDNSENDNSIKNAIYDVVNPSFVNLASEIRDIMVYIASETRGGAVEQIFLMGSLARLSGIDLVIDKLISIPVKILNPFYGIEVENASNTLHDLGPVAGVAVATGLALRGH